MITSDFTADVELQVAEAMASEDIIPPDNVEDETEDITESVNHIENKIPSYTEVEDMDLPSYEDLGTKRLQIGFNVIVMDKNMHVTTFNSSNV